MRACAGLSVLWRSASPEVRIQALWKLKAPSRNRPERQQQAPGNGRESLHPPEASKAPWHPDPRQHEEWVEGVWLEAQQGSGDLSTRTRYCLGLVRDHTTPASRHDDVETGATKEQHGVKSLQERCTKTPL